MTYCQQKLFIVLVFSLLNKVMSSKSFASDRDAVIINQGGIT